METTTQIGPSLKALRTTIVLTAKQRADKIMQDTRTTIAAIEQDLVQKREYLQQKRLAEITDHLDKEIVDVRTVLSRDESATVLQFKQDALDNVIKEIKKRFSQKMLDDPAYYYGKYLAKIIKDTLAMISFKEYFLTLNARDADYVQKHDFLKQFGKKIILKDEHLPADEIGCIMGDKTGSIKVDQRLSKKLETNEKFLKTKLSPILFSE